MEVARHVRFAALETPTLICLNTPAPAAAGLHTHGDWAVGQLHPIGQRSANYWRTRQMSDHLPLWAAINIDNTNTYLQQQLNNATAPVSSARVEGARSTPSTRATEGSELTAA